MSRTIRRDKTYSELRAEAVAYYKLCDRASALGLPVSLDNPESPTTVRGLRRSVRRAERALVTA